MFVGTARASIRGITAGPKSFHLKSFIFILILRTHFFANVCASLDKIEICYITS